MNTVQIMGFLGKDPVIRATQTGRAMANMSVAVNRTYTDARGNRQELTDWVEVVAWGNLAEEVYNHLKKGSYVYIEGRYSTGSYIGKDGTRKYSTKVMANVVALPLRTRLASTEGQQPMGNGIAGNAPAALVEGPEPASRQAGPAIPIQPAARPMNRKVKEKERAVASISLYHR